jgi:hypothetical protein
VILILTATLTSPLLVGIFIIVSLSRVLALSSFPSLSLSLSLSLSKTLSERRKQAFYGVIAVPKFKPATVTTGNL